MLKQYVALAGNASNSTIEELSKHWNMYPIFAFQLDLSPFSANSPALQEVIKNPPKFKTSAANGVNGCKSAVTVEPNTELNPMDCVGRLVSSVRKHGHMLLNPDIDERDFWGKVSSELTPLSGPEEKSKDIWANLFYSHFKKFIKMNKRKGAANWPYYKDYEQIGETLVRVLTNKLEQRSRAVTSVAASRGLSSKAKVSRGDISDIPRKTLLIKLMTPRLKDLGQQGTEASNASWAKVKKEMIAAGMLPAHSQIDLRSYFISMVRNYCEALDMATSNTEANKICPFFYMLRKLDLSPFLPKFGPIIDKASYVAAKSRFN
jgi:hypothetical protein